MVVEEEREFEGAGAADGEGFDDELAAEFDAIDVGARFEGEIWAGFGGGCGGRWVRVWILVFLFLIALFFCFSLSSIVFGGEVRRVLGVGCGSGGGCGVDGGVVVLMVGWWRKKGRRRRGKNFKKGKNL